MTSLTATKDDPKGCTRTTVPVAPFTSPFIGWSVQKLKDHFVENVTDFLKFTAYTFIVLDERTEQDETCCLVSIFSDPEDYDSDTPLEEHGGYVVTPTNKPSTARSDFYVAAEVLVPIEARDHAFNEGTRREWYENGEFLYTKERMIDLMGPDYNMKTLMES